METTNPDWAWPYKLGRPVLIGSDKKGAFDEQAVDCPFVFRHRNRFYMMYVGFDGMGYQTALAVSDNLLDWQPYGMILKRGNGSGWDDCNTAGTWMLRDSQIDGPGTLKRWDGKYWLAYHAYPESGFERGAASIGLAWTKDENLLEWHRLPEPVLTAESGDDWENGGLYKECLLEHNGLLYLFYNAKNKPKESLERHHWREQIGYATSVDMLNWNRAPHNPVLPNSPGRWDSIFVSEPCIVYDGKQWLMYYFGFDGRHAQNGIALSNHLALWTKYPEPIVAAGVAGEIDSTHAHKPSVFFWNGVLYHFYVACRPYQQGDATMIFGNEFRTISVAASKPWASF